MINVKDSQRILFIGDSITDIKFNRRFNHKLKGKNIWALQVSKQLKKKYKSLKFFYRGIASNRTYHLYDRLTKDCISLKPDIIIMLIGVNDAWENYVPDEYPPLLRPMEPHMREIYRRIKTELPDTQLLILLPFLIDTLNEKLPFHNTLDEFIERLRAMAEENTENIIDLQQEFYTAQKSTNPAKLAVDGIHPTNLGHEVICNAVLSHINQTQ